MKTQTLWIALAFAAGLTVRAEAQQQAAPTGVRGEMYAQFDDAATKLVQLAGAFPADKYAWRPGAGVRSTGEALMHAAGATYFFLNFAGVKGPAMTEADEAKTTDPAQIAGYLKQSMDFGRAAIRDLPDADLDKPAQMFGQNTTYRNVYLSMVMHMHEHLGQLIAYARMNGITPPWSKGQ